MTTLDLSRSEIDRLSNLHDELVEALRSIANQAEIADDPEHHTLGLIKHLARNALAKVKS